MRVGVFGGSFDPVHCGHLHVARQAARSIPLDQVRFIPTGLQPLKASGSRASADDRVAMLELALVGTPDFVIDRREVERPGPSYTVDTLREIKAESPADRLFLIIGADAAQYLALWRDPVEVAKLATIVVALRPGAAVPVLPAGAVVLDIPPSEVSATAIREAVGRSTSLDQLVPATVAEYIAVHGLYRTGA